MTLQPLLLDFFIYEENLFYQCNKSSGRIAGSETGIWVQLVVGASCLVSLVGSSGMTAAATAATTVTTMSTTVAVATTTAEATVAMTAVVARG